MANKQRADTLAYIHAIDIPTTSVP